MNTLFTPNRQPLACILFLLFFSAAAFGQKGAPRLTDTINFRVNLSYMVTHGTFHPATDSVVISGNMDTVQKKRRMQRIDTTYLYETSYALTAGAFYSYKFSIYRPDSIIKESVDSLTRIVHVPDSIYTVTNDFNNYNPAKVPMTFVCDLYYQIRSLHFVPHIDYLDVAGNFNNNGANDVLFQLPHSTDSLYTVTLFMDTAKIGDTLKFKFRFNGNWVTSELQGDPDRTYVLLAAGNTFTCWYNNIDPNNPAVPIASDVVIQGTDVVGEVLTGSYVYEDYNLYPEDTSVYKWYRADSITQPQPLLLTDTLGLNYVLDTLDIGKYIAFEVTPVAKNPAGLPVVGLPVRKWMGKIGGVGITNLKDPSYIIYPNPVSGSLAIENTAEVNQVSVYNITGTALSTRRFHHNGRIVMDVSSLNPGLYLVKIYTTNGETASLKFIKE
jgi:hypothetical protein